MSLLRGEEEDDPVAKFLDTERNELGDLSDEFNLNAVASSSMQDCDWSADGIHASSLNEEEEEEEEPESVRKWREDFEERIRVKDEDERVQIERWREEASKELEQWMRDEDASLKERIKEAEKGSLSLDAVAIGGEGGEDGSVWERVAVLCDFGQTNKIQQQQQTDLVRMKTAILSRAAGIHKISFA